MSEIFIGKRKRAVARVRVEKGEKKLIINHKDIENFPKVAQLRILEPLLIAEDDGFTINANVRGGGIMGQAEAVAQGTAIGLVKLKGEKLKEKFMDYDRNLLIPDVRRTEPHKPSRSKKGPRRHKQRSKR
jgi:small subunit ribosomal protein S9